MVISSSLLRAIYPRQSLVIIVVHVLVGYCVSLGINRGVRIYGTLARTPKIIKKKILSFSWRLLELLKLSTYIQQLKHMWWVLLSLYLTASLINEWGQINGWTIWRHVININGWDCIVLYLLLISPYYFKIKLKIMKVK